VRDLLDLAPLDAARFVVEFGAGTGACTREIVPRLQSNARLLAFEINHGMAAVLAREVTDPRVRVVNDSAANVEAYLGGRTIDVLVCTLPLTALPAAVRAEILTTSRRVLAPAGTMLVLQYSTWVRSQLERTFSRVDQRLSARNVPPAFLYRCRPDPAPPAAALQP
jgi:phospholipid N-methyltransferase